MSERLAALTPEDFTKPPWSEVIEVGRYNARLLASLLGWKDADLARYLGKSSSALSRQAAAPKDQKRLAALVAVLAVALDMAGGNLDALRAWLEVPNWAFDHKSAKELILEGQLEQIRDLLEELEAGTVA